MVSGNAWEPEELQHTLRMLELIHRADVPVVPGAIFPLVRTEEESKIQRQLYGSFSWYGAWGDIGANTSRQLYHGPYIVPKLAEGEPSTKPLAEDAAHFLIRQVHAYPHEVTIYAAGPLTNIALAISIDPHFAELTQGIVIMGGSIGPAHQRSGSLQTTPDTNSTSGSIPRPHTSHSARTGRASASQRSTSPSRPASPKRCSPRSLARRTQPQSISPPTPTSFTTCGMSSQPRPGSTPRLLRRKKSYTST